MQINEEKMYRLNDLYPPKQTGRKPLLPFSRATFCAGVKDKKYPQPIKYGPRIFLWKGKDLKEFLLNGIGSRES
jgi:predicted DNA-binding transcriptional regulator AlpA